MGKFCRAFDLSTGNLVPSPFPFTVVASRDGRRAVVQLVERIAGGGTRFDRRESRALDQAGGTRRSTGAGIASHRDAAELERKDTVRHAFKYRSGCGGHYRVRNAVRIYDNLPRRSESSRVILRSPWRNRRMANCCLWQFIARCDRCIRCFDCGRRACRSLENDRVDGLHPDGLVPQRSRGSRRRPVIATAKGEGTRPNKEMGKTAYETKHHDHPYIPTLLRGLDCPTEHSGDSRKACRNSRKPSSEIICCTAIPGRFTFAGGQNPIKHVIYVIKENRTYDQILGDLKVGRRRSFAHACTERTSRPTSTNSRCSSACSTISTTAEKSPATAICGRRPRSPADYNEKTWQIAYRGKERTYDFQGQVADEYPLDHNQPDIDDPGTGFLWDNLARNHVSFRDYGEFVNAEWCNEKVKAASPKQGTPSGQEAEMSAHGREAGRHVAAECRRSARRA